MDPTRKPSSEQEAAPRHKTLQTAFTRWISHRFHNLSVPARKRCLLAFCLLFGSACSWILADAFRVHRPGAGPLQHLPRSIREPPLKYRVDTNTLQAPPWGNTRIIPDTTRQHNPINPSY
ncbi:hypothetical protein H7F15_12270 [Pontibacter sp. Tf4]|uniref:hypothetical protein n=1 Tax=Pontibacter sp. Tf4 TaxID=2761620 RepID=UPI001628B178|nr:hypothetical protein [Pontibacter sp. Tf4]MBB6611817.1 hypothetical protein [Pontibacter sp. Tf4]